MVGTCACAHCRTRWLMGPSMVTADRLFSAQTTDVAQLDCTWPAWILLLGVVKLLQSTASSAGPHWSAAGTGAAQRSAAIQSA